MTETVKLPCEIRRCPSCARDGFIARRATRGGGWGGQGIRALFVCEQCGYKELVESASDRVSQTLSSALLLLLGLISLFAMDPPASFIIGLFLIALGGYAFYDSLMLHLRRMPTVGQRDSEVPEVDLEEELFLSDADAAKARKCVRLVTGAVLLVLVLSILILVWDLIYA